MIEEVTYFFLTLGGPLYKTKLIKSIRGFAINQHAGFSPQYKGSNTINWALYHRKLDFIGSTIHIIDSGADSGLIFRRSNVVIQNDDTLNTIFNRTVALGNELMIEVINEIIDNDYIRIFQQPKYSGNTYLFKEFTSDHMICVLKDLRNGWLNLAIKEQRKL